MNAGEAEEAGSEAAGRIPRACPGAQRKKQDGLEVSKEKLVQGNRASGDGQDPAGVISSRRIL